ncbi:hypothetical protein M153_3100029775 [Pseudoloma neurophilia]|uniref:Uncharacterized protein n=1 Tax=Pseudoloma neurophilia TaxID=146866 RepID=A0A0R0M6T7_9MICR|nr:hypothetical protein M153_3100029775 [Pseudoloma neurophilia]
MFEVEKSEKNCAFRCWLQTKNLQFDCPADIADFQFKMGTKPIMVKPLKTTSKRIFISSENSLGIFFITHKVQIFITRPLFELLILKIKELQSYFVDYEEMPDENFRSIFDANIEKTKSMINFVSYGEEIYFSRLSIRVESSNTFIGWCNFIIEYNQKKICYISTFSTKNRISFKAKQENVDILAINSLLLPKSMTSFLKDNTKAPETSGIQQLDDLINNSGIKLIPVNFTSNLYEVLLHILAVHSKDQVYICAENVQKYIDLLNSFGKWLPDKFRIDIQDMIPKENKNLMFASSLVDLDFIHPNSVIFCSIEEYRTLLNSRNATTFYKDIFSKILESIDKQANIDMSDLDNSILKTDFAVQENLTQNSELISGKIDDLEKNIYNKFYSTDIAIRACNLLEEKVRTKFLIKCLFKSKFNNKALTIDHIVININDCDFPADHKIDFGLYLDLRSAINFYNPKSIVYQRHGILQEYNPINDKEKLQYPHTYILDVTNLHILHDLLFLQDASDENRVLKSDSVKTSQLLKDHFINIDDCYYFKNERKKVKINGQNVTIEKF